MPRPVWVPEDEAEGERLGSVGSITTYDGELDEDQRRELDEKLSRRIPAGFAPGKRKRVSIGGRRAGSWPKVPWLS